MIYFSSNANKIFWWPDTFFNAQLLKDFYYTSGPRCCVLISQFNDLFYQGSLQKCACPTIWSDERLPESYNKLVWIFRAWWTEFRFRYFFLRISCQFWVPAVSFRGCMSYMHCDSSTNYRPKLCTALICHTPKPMDNISRFQLILPTSLPIIIQTRNPKQPV